MKLEHISFQRRGAKHEVPFSQLYKGWFSQGIKPNSPWMPVVAAIVELLHRLETEVDAPPCWLCTSHFSVVFSRQDASVYGQGEAGDVLFTLDYGRSVPDGSCWNIPAFVIKDFNGKRHQLATVDEAIQAIIMILRHAEIFGDNEDGGNSLAKLEL